MLGAGAIGAYVGAAPGPRRRRRHPDRPGSAPARRWPSTASGCCRPAATSPPVRAVTGDLAAVADADVVFVALKAYSLPEIAPRLGQAARARRRGHLGAERHPVVVLPVALPDSAAGLTGLQSVDPGGVIAASIGPSTTSGASSTARPRSSSRASSGTSRAPGSRSASRTARSRRAVQADLGGLRRGRPAGAGRRPAARSDLAQARRQRGVQPDHRADRGDARRARRAAGDARSAARHLRRVRLGRRPARDHRSRCRWTAGWRPGWRSATTRRRCSRTWRPASGSSWTA